MLVKNRFEKIAISVASHRLKQKLLLENPGLTQIFTHANNLDNALEDIKAWVLSFLKSREQAYNFYLENDNSRQTFEALDWQEIAAIRILDYIDHTDRTVEDLNLHGEILTNHPFLPLWLAIKKGRGGGTEAYFKDMIELFRQFSGKSSRQMPSKEDVMHWMDRHPSGMDEEIVKIREANKIRILKIIIQKIDKGEINNARYIFGPGLSPEEKFDKALEWWDTSHFHMKFAVRSPELLNKMLGYSLDDRTIDLMEKAKGKGIPFFVNPYYLSLINITVPDFAIGADQTIRDYIFCSEELIEEFGEIVAWEKEDIVKPGKPNAAGWILPNTHNVHRRYPEVAILIPDTVGRACGGLCVSCQRMYDFQNGHLNFNLDKLKPNETWHDKLIRLLGYFENDSQLRDILITGGDALMSSNKSIKLILDEVYEMALRKISKNKELPDGEKHAEMLRVRLGTRLPVYIPQRITDELTGILAEFKEKASGIGFKKFVIQTHFESAMEVTPEVKKAIEKILKAGWIVANQQVFIASASKRGHTAKLRKILNDIGVLTYYTFSVKGYQENRYNFATNARAIQEQKEEKVLGEIPGQYYDEIASFPLDAENMVKNINRLRNRTGLPFLGTDRNVLNMPGVGKSLTFRTIGITHDGRRILEFDHDKNRWHSPIIDEMGKIVIVESKSIAEYLEQMMAMGEDLSEYESLFGYSLGLTEPRMPIYNYPAYDFEVTDELTNFEMAELTEQQK